MFARANHGDFCEKGTQKFILKMLIVALLVMLFVCSSAFKERVYGATVTAGEVTVRSGNVRKDASASSGIVFCVASGESVAILSEEKGQDGNTWYKVSVGNSVGYVRSDLIKKTEKKVNVSDSLVSTPKSTQGLLSSGDESKNDRKNDDNQVKTENDTKKFNELDETDKKEERTFDTDNSKYETGVVNATYVRMRSVASTQSSIVTYLDRGAVVYILGEGKAADGEVWYQVKNGDNTGFVRCDLINKNTKPKDEKTEEEVITEEDEDDKDKDEEEVVIEDENEIKDEDIIPGEGKVKGTGVRIRSTASTLGDIIKSTSQDENLLIYGMTEGDDRKWYKVKLSVAGEEKTGYIASDYVILTKEVSIKEEKKEDTQEEEVKEEEAEEEITVEDIINRTAENAASIKGVGVRMRETPVVGNIVCQLSNGHPLTVLSDTTGEDGNKWYEVSFSYMGSPKKGYVREDFVIRNAAMVDEAPIGDEDFEHSIEKLPDSYKNQIRALHEKHPKWTFTAVNTGLEWSDALAAESSVGKNLVSKNSIASWKSTAAQAYNWSNNTWYTFDGGSWASASPELIAYYMDPRNFLNDSGIYQFECLDFDENQTTESVSKMLTGTFMSNEFTDTDGTVAKYSDIFMLAGQMTGVSPYLLAGRCIQEQGLTGDTQSVSGNVSGYANLFNYFNVGAYAYGGRSATINGLIYASGTDDAYARPWNTRVKSIYGGARYIADQFITRGQNTLYFQKFNVVNTENTLYSHQYMSNIQAASSESARLQLAYINDDQALNFRIPYYNNMPETVCMKPTSDSSPNTYLSSLSVDGCELIPQFSGVNENYTVKADSSMQSVTINATAVSADSAIGGLGTYNINSGANVFYVVCKAQNGSVKTYTITVIK